MSISIVAPARAEAPAKLEERLDAIVKEAYPNEDEPGAAVIVVVDGKPVLRKGYGLADVESGAKITPERIFRIGSVTKQFTAVAILQLVQQGKVQARRSGHEIRGRLRHARRDDHDRAPAHAHVGHAELHGGAGLQQTMTRKLSPREIVALVDGKPLDFEPGSKFKYSNTNYVLLGMVIEKASGQTYADYMLEHVFKPAGMKDTPLRPQRYRGRQARAGIRSIARRVQARASAGHEPAVRGRRNRVDGG